ncbi:MAG: hypothetical protein ISP90_17985 [Nevskia sp.]|nr:hypothetical protein [Nevskia sp.]
MEPATATGHGVFLLVHGCGTLLRGRSGAGKSELALELVARGHQLVADDAVDWRRGADGRVTGSCPQPLAGFIEIRGLGVLNVGALYGSSALAPSAALELVIELGAGPGGGGEERLHGRRGVFEVLGAQIAAISLPARLGHNSAVLVEAACRDHLLRKSGYRADQDLVARQRRLLEPRPSDALPDAPTDGAAPAPDAGRRD